MSSPSSVSDEQQFFIKQSDSQLSNPVFLWESIPEATNGTFQLQYVESTSSCAEYLRSDDTLPRRNPYIVTLWSDSQVDECTSATINPPMMLQARSTVQLEFKVCPTVGSHTVLHRGESTINLSGFLTPLNLRDLRTAKGWTVPKVVHDKCHLKRIGQDWVDDETGEEVKDILLQSDQVWTDPSQLFPAKFWPRGRSDNVPDNESDSIDVVVQLGFQESFWVSEDPSREEERQGDGQDEVLLRLARRFTPLRFT